VTYHFDIQSSTKYIDRYYAKKFHLMIPDLWKWHPYKEAMHSSTNILPFEVCLGFQSCASTKMLLIFHISVSEHKHHENQADHSGVQNLSQTHAQVATSFQRTRDHAKQHHVSYLKSQQC